MVMWFYIFITSSLDFDLHLHVIWLSSSENITVAPAWIVLGVSRDIYRCKSLKCCTFLQVHQEICWHYIHQSSLLEILLHLYQWDCRKQCWTINWSLWGHWTLAVVLSSYCFEYDFSFSTSTHFSLYYCIIFL